MKLRCIKRTLQFFTRIAGYIKPVLFATVVLLSGLGLREGFADAYGSRIMAFYKGSDGYGDANNPVKMYFEQELLKSGLAVDYHDIDRGLPDTDNLENTRAIITWYNSSTVPNRDKGIKYIRYLNGAVDRGVKLIIINSFGAYGYKDDGVDKWDLIDEIKPLFIKMGFSFRGYWTNDPGILRISQIDREMAEKDGKQDVGASRHYQLLVPIRSDVTTYLTVKRTDSLKGLGDGESSVIMTSKNGGFALEQYVTMGNRMMLNPSLFLRKSLFYGSGVQDVGIILGDIPKREAVEKNLEYTFRYAKISNAYIDIKQLKTMVAEDLLVYRAIVIALNTLEKIPVRLLQRYLELGGRAVFIQYADIPKDYLSLMGLSYYGRSPKYFKEGFSINPSFFMNGAQVSGSKLDTNVREARLSDGRALATVNDSEKKENYPALWERSIGKGKLLYWNMNIIPESKRFRGTIVQSIHYITDYFVSGMANIAMMMIDDFPAPLWNTNYREYRIKSYNEMFENESDSEKKKKLGEIVERLRKYPDITDTDFIRNVWLKDITSFQKNLGFKYSSYVIFNYSKETGYKKSDDEFSVRDFYLAEGALPIKMGYFALNSGWDMGLHGYNHQSMTLTRPRDYASEPWRNRDAMVKGLTVARNEWEKIFTPATLPFSYVAPHNIIDSDGLSALGEVFPSIHVVSAVYMSSQGENEQEFEFTKDLRFFQVPRLTFGYVMNDQEKYVLYDGIHNSGIISHFIHPDDVFDESRSRGFTGWDWMKNQFAADFTMVNRNFPWLRWMTVKDAYDEFQFYNNTSIRVRNEPGRIIVESSDGSDRYIFFRITIKNGSTIVKSENCTQVFGNTRTGDYVYKTNESRCEISVR